MKRRLLELLVCPIDKTPLDMVEWETTPVKLSAEEIFRLERLGLDPALFSIEIITGVLVNRARKIFYPIHQGVPRMLVFPTGVARHFVEEHAARISRELPGFTSPQEKSKPGEETILRSFSSEWVNYDWKDSSYWNLSPDVMYKTMNFMLDLNRRPVRNKLVLEVGIGIGGIADYIARTEECELVGVDLSYAVDPAFKHFGKNPFLHIIQSSAFAPQFRPNTFDLVYSHGVLHHTFSTKTAFDEISKLPKFGGRLYIWVYNPRDERASLVRHALMLGETIFRPVCWRLPSSLQTIMLLPILSLYLIHQNLFGGRKGSAQIRYGIREAMHAARDRFTPRYAHRHTEEEVCGWFSEAGYTDVQCGSKRERPDFVPISFILSTRVDGFRAP